MVGFLRLEQKQGLRSVMRDVVLAKVVRVSSGHDGIDADPPSVAVIGMHPPATPRIVGKDDGRGELTNDASHLPSELEP